MSKIKSVIMAGSLSLLLTQIPFANAGSSAEKSMSINLTSFDVSENGVIQSPNDKREYKVIHLENGLEVLLISDPDLKNSAASLSVSVGSQDNPDSQLGLAHYLEHMLFLGSERYPTINEYSKFMSQNGGYTNAYTAQDRTVYGFEVNDKAFDEGLDRLGDVMRAPLLDEKHADKERHTVNAENETYIDNDMRKLYALQRYTLNPAYPTARFSTGDLTTLVDKKGSKLQTELERFFAAHYSANVMKVALTSPRTIKELEVAANQYLLQIPNRKVEKQAIIEPMVTPKQLAIKVEMKPTANIKMLQVNFLVPSVKAEYMYKPGDYINRLIGSDHKGGLSDTLIKAGLVDSVMSGFSAAYSDLYSQFSVQFKLTTKGLKNEDEVLATLYAYIALVEKEGINETQYNALKTSLDTRFTYLRKQAGFNYVMGLSAAMQQYQTKDVIYQPYRLDSFNKAFITEMIGYLTPKNSRLFLISPNAKADTQIPYYKGQYSVSKVPPRQQAKWLEESKSIKMILPAENHWTADNLQLLDKTNTDKSVQLIDKKGHSVWFQNSAFFDEPKSSISLQLNSDLADKDVKSSVTFALMDSMLNKSLFDLNFSTSEAGVNFLVYRDGGLKFVTSGYSQKQPELMLALLDHTKSVKFTDQSLNLAKQEVQRRIENKAKSKPINLAMGEIGSLIRLRNWTDEDVLKALDAIKMNDIDSLKSAIFTQSSLRLLALGNINKEEVLELDKAIQKRVTVQEKDFYQPKRFQANSKKGVINYQLKTQLQDDALVVLFVREGKNKKEVVTGELLNQLLKPAFYDQIRTQEQLTYSPFSLSLPIDKSAGFGLLTQTPAVSNAELYARFNAFLATFKTSLAKFDEKKFEEIKQAHIANYTAKPNSLSDEFSYLGEQWSKLESDINGKQAYISLLESVSLKEVQAFYNKVLMDEKGIQKIIIQVQGQRFKTKPVLTLKGEINITQANQL